MIVLVFLVLICCVVCESIGIVSLCSFFRSHVYYHNRRVNTQLSTNVHLFDKEQLSDLSLSKGPSLSLYNARSSEELYDSLRNPASCSVDTFMSTLKSLIAVRVDRKSIPDDVVKSIVAYVAGIRYSGDCISAMHSLCILNFEATDFNVLFLTKFQSICESTLTSSPKALFRVLGTLQFLKYDKVSPGILLAIDKALGNLSKDPSTRCDNVLSKLGHAGFTWSSLSGETRVALQHAMNREIPQMNGVQFNKLLFSLNLLKAKYTELPITRDSIVVHSDRYVNATDTSNLLKNMGQIEVPWTSLSLQVQLKLEPLFIDYFRSERQDHTLYYFAQMNFRVSDESELLTEFIKVELSKHLDKLTPETFSILFKALSDIKIKWSMFSTESQQQLLNTISRLLPQMNDRENYFTMASLASMNVPFEKLSEDLKEKVEHYASKVWSESKTNGFCSTIDSLGKMGFKYASLFEDTKKLFQARLLTHLTATDHKGVCIVLVGLSGMGVTSSDLSEELVQCIGSLVVKHKQEFSDLHSKHRSSLDESLKSIFKSNSD